MSNLGTNSVSSVLSTLTTGFEAAEGAIITGVASWFGTELLALTVEAINQIWTSLNHFIANLKSGAAWGAAMASMLTELWNDVKSDLADLATNFVDAVGKVFQSVGLIPV